MNEADEELIKACHAEYCRLKSKRDRLAAELKQINKEIYELCPTMLARKFNKSPSTISKVVHGPYPRTGSIHK